MIDFDEALATTVRTKGPRCQLCRLLDSLDETQRAKVQRGLDSQIEQTRIARTIGVMTGESVWDSRGQMVAKHRAEHMK